MTHKYTYSNEAIAYSTFRKTWRAEYKTVSQEIRDLKREAAEQWKAGHEHRAARAQSCLHAARGRASDLMVEHTDEKAVWKALLASGHVARTPTVLIAAE